jgi:tRNA pseudouridine38-40 synthase
MGNVLLAKCKRIDKPAIFPSSIPLTHATDGDVKTRRLLLTIAFDGTDFEGWQGRPGARTVRSVLAQACSDLWDFSPIIESSSRTDSGVHARALVAHLDFPQQLARIDHRHVMLALNARLPRDLRIMKCQAPRTLRHARFDATSKEYRYHLHLGAVMPPHLAREAWHIPQSLNLPAMQSAAAKLIGQHDFRAFTVKRRGTLGSSTRTLYECRVQQRGATITIHLHGDGFLYKMCRKIVGTLVQIGQEKFPPSIIQQMLSEAPTTLPHLVAPAHGLTLWRVHYTESKSRKVESRKLGELMNDEC